MFIGHYALAFGAKKAAPMVSLGSLVLACQFADLLWPTLVMLGIEIVEVDPGNTLVTPLNFVTYPYSHSLVALVGWSALFALGYRAIRGWHPVAIATIAALVFSHYVLDVITHRPDLPITLGGSRRLGLGLWNHPGSTLAVESLMFIVGTTIYMSATRARPHRPYRVARADRGDRRHILCRALRPAPTQCRRRGGRGTPVLAVRVLGLLGGSAPRRC